MNISIKHLLFATIVTSLANCSSSKQASILYSDSYDAGKDRTTVMMFPLGQVNLPGKWIKGHYNEVSFQQFFTNGDSAHFAVALNHWKKYEFYTKDITPSTFAHAFYKWEADYLEKKLNAKSTLIKEDKAKNFILWNLKGADFNTYFLFGLKNTTAYNLSIDAGNWTESKKVEFLQNIYNE